MSVEQLELTSLRHRHPGALQPVQSESNTTDDADAQRSDDADIYRGQRSPSLRSSSPTSTRSSLSSTSSSASAFVGGTLGALASVVEQAVTKWARTARGRSSSSSSSSSSITSSLRSSKSAPLRPSQSRRRARRPSVSSLHSAHSEKEIAARITRRKALEEFRQVPREFILYLPPALVFSRTSRRANKDSDDEYNSSRMIRSSSISFVLNQLDFTLKKTAKTRRDLGKASPGSPRHIHGLVTRPMGQSRPLSSGRPSSPSIGPHPHRGRKGKQREGSGNAKRLVRFAESTGKSSKAWFLDVASPTWEDLRAIGKLLHLHPLTLEDILQQEPREKIDFFPRLGYYFVSFRAIETREGQEKYQRQLQLMNEHLEPLAGLRDGAIGETYVYLVVFSEGICCFHYNDVAEHTDRIRNRLTLLEDMAVMSSDWVAHGILDSIVDSFFPYLEEIEKEVMVIEDLVFSPTPAQDAASMSTANPSTELLRKNSLPQSITSEKKGKSKAAVSMTEMISLNEKSPHLGGGVRPRFVAPKWTFPLILRRIRRFWSGRWKRRRPIPETPPSATSFMLRRMARVRRLVTSLNRLLSSKSEVITQIRKRLLRAGVAGLVRGTKAEGLEVAMYMGDVQDHILTLQHSLAHYERMLSQSHPTYLLQLRTIVASSKASTDETLVYLTSVSMAVLSVQLITSAFSMNINLPATPNDFRMFGGVVAICVVVFFVYMSVVMYWWRKADKKRDSPL